jgi:PAS domain S-box-containing protein
VSLNEMRDNLGKYLGQIAAQHQNFQAVLTNLQEGVIATDIDDRVVLINQAAGRLTGTDTDSAGGKHIQSVLPVLEIIRFYEQATSSDVPVSCAFETDLGQGRRQIEVHVVRVPPGASSIHHLLVIRDVTELSGAAAMKAQFVANASHELRTPLATIRAAVDSLAAADPNDRPELAKLTGMLDRHVARLEDMTKDLLDLHMVESAKVPLNLTEVACGALAAWVKEQFTAPAAEKGLRLDVAAPSPQVRFSSDRKLLELIFRNLIDNAIKFTPAGGRVDCRFEPDEGGLCVTIGDTGCGISAKDLSHVFERFYQGDAARSGQAKTRGTGLGLAIVKHASERLGAKVELTSQLGQGTQVTVVIPNARSSPL